MVGVDFSEGSAGALQTGRALAGLGGSQVCVVHVRRERSAPWRPGRSETAWMREHRVDPETVRLRHGEPWVELVKLAEEVGATLVVAGTHGRSGFQPFRLGTTAANVALRCRAPVVLVSPQVASETKRNAVTHEEVP
ncbi:MAG: universal stress protein [Longimicrobiales bacterium]|nr:universal stress protein [Longimicrobiales bacterium]